MRSWGWGVKELFGVPFLSCLFPDSVVYCTYLIYRKMILCVLCVSATLSALWDANSCVSVCRDSSNNSKSIL